MKWTVCDSVRELSVFLAGGISPDVGGMSHVRLSLQSSQTTVNDKEHFWSEARFALLSYRLMSPADANSTWRRYEMPACAGMTREG